MDGRLARPVGDARLSTKTRAQSLEPAFLHADRLLAPYGDWRQPMMPIGLLAFDNGVELLLDGPGDGPRNAFAYRDLVDGSDRSDFRGGAAEERFVSEVEHFARDHLFENRDVQVASDLEHRVAGNAGEHRVAEGRGLEHAIAHEEDVFARDHLFENRDVQVASDLEHRVAGNAGEHRVAEGRGLEHAIAHEEDVFA